MTLARSYQILFSSHGEDAVTERKQVVAVPDRKGWLLLLSVQDPGRFLSALRQAQ